MANIRIDIEGKVAVSGWLTREGKRQFWLAEQCDQDEAVFSKMLSGLRDMPDDVIDTVKSITGINLRRFKKVA